MPDCQRPLEAGVAPIDLPGALRGGEITGVLEGHRRRTADGLAHGQVQPVDTGPRLYVHRDRLAAIGKGARREGQAGKDDVLRRSLAEYDGAGTARGEADRGI